MVPRFSRSRHIRALRLTGLRAAYRCAPSAAGSIGASVRIRPTASGRRVQNCKRREWGRQSLFVRSNCGRAPCVGCRPAPQDHVRLLWRMSTCERLPDAVRYHANWKQSETHPACWELSPTIDHVVPVARGGSELDARNIVTTSMLNNARKANWTLGELGWPDRRAPVVQGWDGLVAWFEGAFDSIEAHRLGPWRRAFCRCCRAREARPCEGGPVFTDRVETDVSLRMTFQRSNRPRFRGWWPLNGCFTACAQSPWKAGSGRNRQLIRLWLCVLISLIISRGIGAQWSTSRAHVGCGIVGCV